MTVNGTNTNPIVHIPGLGAVCGELDNKVPVVRFLNVPFAIIHKRWNPAKPIHAWEGVRDATKIGFSPPQSTKMIPFLEMISGIQERPYEEVHDEKECLNLNIFVPHQSVLGSDEPLPVMVWVYGGAFCSGGNYAPLYDGTTLVATSVERKKPVIVVVINYRVNYFGFLASKELKEDIDSDPSLTGEQKAVGNWGLQDQKLAFLWVRDHIAAFRGNNKNITAFGESAGAVSLAYHMMMPAHHGLFDKAIIQSGALLTIATQDIEIQGQPSFDGLCSHLGIPKETPAKEKVERLRDAPEKIIAEFVGLNPRAIFHPTVDGILIDSHVQHWFDDAARLDPGVKKVLIGMNRDEGSIFGSLEEFDVNSWSSLRSRFGTETELAVFDQVYGQPGEDPQKLAVANVRVMSDIIFQAPILHFTSMLVHAPHVDTSIYFFDCTSARMEAKMPGLGACHAMDLLYLFGSAPSHVLLTENELWFGQEIRNVWLEFASKASPEIVPVAQQLRPGENNVILFQRDWKVGRTDVNWISKDALDFWRRFFIYQRERLLKVTIVATVLHRCIGA